MKNEFCRISILVPTLGQRPEEFLRLLESIEKQNYLYKEVVVVSQKNHDIVNEIIDKFPNLVCFHIKTDELGLSKARNLGIKYCKGDIIMLSDDDCWYEENALKNINCQFKNNIDILLTQIYDKQNEKYYKNYNKERKFIRKKMELMSRSSIEIAFRRDIEKAYFDENFGLGAQFVCGEEIDFLLSNFKGNNILYDPEITVYHPRKNIKNKGQIVAKGALYAKHYSVFLCFAVLLRDLIVKHENNFIEFMNGYKELRKLEYEKSININS